MPEQPKVSPKNPMNQPGWWIELATDIPMKFLESVLMLAERDGVITLDQIKDIRGLAIEALREHQ